MEEAAERVHALGEGLLLGTACALVWAIPAASRVGSSGGALAYMALAGSGALIAGPLVASARSLRPLSSRVRWTIAGLFAAAGPLTLLGTVLKDRTHHRPLGGVTFACIALGLLVFFAILALLLRAAAHRGSRVARWSGVALLAVSVALLTFRLGGAVRDPAVVRAVLDGLVGVALVAFGVWLDAAPMRRVARAGLVAWLIGRAHV